MIRLPPSRILPGQDDIHHHLEHVFARVAARYDNMAPDSEDDADDEDDYGYDLASIPESDLSFAPSTPPADEGFHSESGSGFNSAVECQRRNGYGDVVSSVADGDHDDPGDNEQQYIDQDQSQDQDSHRTHASYETAPESIYTPGVDDGEVSSAGMSYMEMARARHSTYLSIGNLMTLGMYPWPGHSLLPIHRVNPRVLMGIPEDDIWPAQQTEVSSLGTLFNGLSLNTLPEDTHSHQTDQSENQKPGASKTKKDQSQTFDAEDKEPSFSKDTNRSRLIYSPTYPTSQTSDIQPEMPGSIQDDNTPQTGIIMSNTPLPQSTSFEPNDTEPDTENESNSTRAMASHNRGRGRKPGNATRGGRRMSNTSQAPVQNDTPVAGSKSSRGARNSRQTSRSVSRSSAVGTDNQASAPHDQNAGPQTAPATQSHPINYAANSRPTNDQQAMTSSMNTVNSSTALAQPSISQAPSDSQSSISPLNANRGMPLQTARDPERWRHMMEVSRIFQSHVNEMITGIENEDDNAEDFGLGEIRRRPIGAWYD